MAGIRIGNQRPQIVDRLAELFQFALLQRGRAGPALLAVVKELRLEQLANLFRDSVGGIIGQVGTGLERARGRRGRLPARHVHGLEMLGHLGDLDGVETISAPSVANLRSVGRGAPATLASSLGLEDLEELFRHHIGRIRDRERAALGDDIGG